MARSHLLYLAQAEFILSAVGFAHEPREVLGALGAIALNFRIATALLISLGSLLDFR
jgi:hypothetical protein